jgi:hypothetical protein
MSTQDDTPQGEMVRPGKGKSRVDFKEAAKAAAREIYTQDSYRADLYVTTTGTGNPIHEYIVVLTREEIPD